MDNTEQAKRALRGLFQIYSDPVPVSELVRRGGPGSGFFGHAGRQGEVGGSSPGDEGAGGGRPSGGGGGGESRYMVSDYRDKEPSSPSDAKRMASDVLGSAQISHGRMSAKTVSFQDLARANAIVITVEDVDYKQWREVHDKMGISVKDNMPRGVLIQPRFINVPSGLTIVG